MNHDSYPIYAYYDKANWDAMNDYLAHFNFNTYYNATEIYFPWEFLKAAIFDCIDFFVLPQMSFLPYMVHPRD